MKYTHRYIARIVLEAKTPLFVGSGETSLLKDALVQKDLHGFPMIQGTSLTGVLRHSLEDNLSGNPNKWNSFFGFHDKKQGEGSQVKISSAYLVLEKGKVAEGLKPGFEISDYKKHFDNLPSRQHVKINDRGVAIKNGLFDNEVVYKGCKFLFEIELKGTKQDKKLWDELLNQLSSPNFRIGQGTRNGYGDLAVASCKTKTFTLSVEADFNAYLEFNPSLNAGNDCLQEIKDKLDVKSNLKHYKLELTPDSFFMFGAGYGDTEVDNIPITEQVISYESGKLKISKPQTLIPASSIKGALSHRTAFHYNKIKGLKAELFKVQFDEVSKIYTGINNKAVFELFGAEEAAEKTKASGRHSVEKHPEGQQGKVIINDILEAKSKIENDKIFNHVAIDRFTGGAIDGALFSEKVSYLKKKDDTITLDIFVDTSEGFSENVIEAFEEALNDICKGLLPLGGMTTKGHGIFTGEII